MSRAIRLCLTALVMTGVLAALVGHHAMRRAGGTEIYLDMEPVDPRDLLLGHYVVLTTPLHRIDTAEVDGPDEGFARGDLVFVSLRETESGSMVPAGVYREPPGGLFVRGRLEDAYVEQEFSEPEPLEDGSPGWRAEPIPGTARDVLRIRYNLERYFAPKDQALALETMRNENRLRLIASIGADGGAVIKGLEIDGERRIEELF
ncbi:MAG: GDYXXLXY domain-containing protein [Oceanicaulis sp.]